MNEKQEITVIEFINMIFQDAYEHNQESVAKQSQIFVSELSQTLAQGQELEVLLKNRLEAGRRLGWIEEQDIINGERRLDRRTCARLLHMYRKLVLGIKDAADITSAYDIKDLFDCRVCANHIAQMVIQGVMEPVFLENIKIFDVYGSVTVEEARVFIKKLFLL